MIVYKTWERRSDGGRTVHRWAGVFLFGIIPLYLSRRER